MSTELEYVLESSNNWFTAIFIYEMFVKLAGIGVSKYCKDKMNWLDGGIVFASIFEVLYQGITNGGGGSSMKALKALRMLRAIRVLRMLRLLRQLKSMQTIILVIVSSYMSFAYITMLMVIFVFIFFELFSHQYMASTSWVVLALAELAEPRGHDVREGRDLHAQPNVGPRDLHAQPIASQMVS